MNPYHRFLLRHRRYCEAPGCLMVRATRVVNVNGKDVCLCDMHAAGQIEQGLRLRGKLEFGHVR